MVGLTRTVYTKKGSGSLLFNIPVDYAKNKGIKKGDKLLITETENEIILRKIETPNTEKGDIG